jgi:hypothetical protein
LWESGDVSTVLLIVSQGVGAKGEGWAVMNWRVGDDNIENERSPHCGTVDNDMTYID